MTEYKTGDLLLFKGNSAISRLITLLPGSDYSHVGFFYNHVVLGPCVFESTSIGNDPDVLTGEKIRGVQVTLFDDRIDNYYGEVFHKPLTEKLTEGRLNLFTDYVIQNHGKPYEEDNLQLVRAELDIFPWHRNREDESSLFCSELAADLLMNLSIIESYGQPTNEFTPSDFAGDVDGYDDLIKDQIEIPDM